MTDEVMETVEEGRLDGSDEDTGAESTLTASSEEPAAYFDPVVEMESDGMESGTESDEFICVISVDSLKFGEFRISDDQHVIRITQKDVLIDAVTFHDRSIQIDFYCLSDSDPLLQKYGVPKSTKLIWHPELAGEIIPEECEMRNSNRELVLKKRNPSEWGGGLLQSSSTSSLSMSSYSPARPYSGRTSTTYRYTDASSSGYQSSTSASLSTPTYHRYSHLTTSRPNYSATTYTPSSTYSSANYQPTVRSRSTSSIAARIPAPPPAPSLLPTSTPPSSLSSSKLASLHSSPAQYSSLTLPPSSKTPPTAVSANAIVRPTAKISPYDEQGTVVDLGFTGLRNIGNTCFMNATLQMLVNCKELQLFFTGDYYKRDINVSNPLGFSGRLAEVFADFMKQMWNGMNRVFEPTRVKELVSEKASQFANFAQHDAHEFLSFLLDGLHEDLNRVKIKPYTTTLDTGNLPLLEASNQAWQTHLLRNDSFFVDLFHGQLKSRLECPRCGQVSITFDPFVYLAVPFPKEKRSSTVYFWPLDPCLKPVKLVIRYSTDGTVSEMLAAVSQLVNVNTKSLRMVEVDNHCFARLFQLSDSVTQIRSTDTIYVFQVHDPTDCNEEVVEFMVVQRLLYRRSLLRACANCHLTDEKLKSCERCYDALYCKRECQIEHWSKEHKWQCKSRPQAEGVGQPFVISLPKSKATFANILRNLESRCRHSVNVFQPPVENNNNNIAAEADAVSDGPADVSPSSSQSVIANNGNPVVVHTAPVIASKRQMVLGEPRNKSRPESRLFIIRRLLQADSVIGETLVDSHEPLDIPSGSFLSINWHNMKFGKDYLTVETKEDVDIDLDKTTLYEKAAATLANSSSSSASNPSLYDMLAMFSETERLKPEESWYCNKCKDHVEATKQLVLFRLPPILIIQLKRFVYTTSLLSMHRRSKDDRPVRYPLSDLDLSEFLCESAPKGQSTKYDLTGVVCHSGSSYFGHYISMGRLESVDGKNTEIDWRRFDDSIVSKIQSSRVQSSDAYLLFYKQRGSATQELLKKRYGVESKS